MDEQIQQENAIWPWLDSDCMADDDGYQSDLIDLMADREHDLREAMAEEDW